MKKHVFTHEEMDKKHCPLSMAHPHGPFLCYVESCIAFKQVFDGMDESGAPVRLYTCGMLPQQKEEI